MAGGRNVECSCLSIRPLASTDDHDDDDGALHPLSDTLEAEVFWGLASIL